MRLLDQRLGVAHEAGQQPDDGLDDGQRGDLSAVEHVVAERELRAPRTPGRGVVEHPLVDALVAAAGEDEVLAGGQLARRRPG